ncbi:substrate-binding domain-containing protein [Devosia sp.]|uniref:substrate-binding domain-containing protein n=1 Tax=Devosia sp. TaxID=1871048 RepID=UPI003BACBD1B
MKPIHLAPTFGVLLTLGLATAPAQAADISACLITATDINPFFVKMKEGAIAKANELGIKLSTYAGKVIGDVETQAAAMESCMTEGVNGILLNASDSKALTPLVEEAKKKGILVIALDTPLEPADAADATFATDNFTAGKLVGAWAKSAMGEGAATAKIATLNFGPAQPLVDVLRNQGFLQGFGIDLADPNKYGDETDPRIVGQEASGAAEEGGRTAMESLLQKEPGINLVYTINEPAAAGAWEAIKAAGKEKDILMVSVDGGCPGVQNIADGSLGATAQQYPLQMAALGVEAIKTFVETGKKPEPTPGLSFFNTGVTLVTDKPAPGVDSIDTKKGLELCWG